MAKQTVKTRDGHVSYEDSQDARDAVFERVLAFFLKHESFSGECIMQSDNPQIYAPELLSELADEVFKFETEYDE